MEYITRLIAPVCAHCRMVSKFARAHTLTSNDLNKIGKKVQTRKSYECTAHGAMWKKTHKTNVQLMASKILLTANCMLANKTSLNSIIWTGSGGSSNNSNDGNLQRANGGGVWCKRSRALRRTRSLISMIFLRWKETHFFMLLHYWRTVHSASKLQRDRDGERRKWQTHWISRAWWNLQREKNGRIFSIKHFNS